MVKTAPLRGSLLGGAIPEEQWNTNTPQVCEKDDISSFEARFDKKLDKLVATIEKYTNNFKQNVGGSAETSWTDLLLFVALGILAIVILDLFFKFGKMIVTTKLEAKYSAMQLQYHNNHHCMEDAINSIIHYNMDMVEHQIILASEHHTNIQINLRIKDIKFNKDAKK